MAHAVRSRDLGSSQGDDAAARRAAALQRIDAWAARHERDASFVATLLEVIADDTDLSPARRASLPADERSVWEQVGGRFDDWEAVARTRARTADAFATLVGNSLDGDAEVAELLGVDRSRVSQRVAQGSLFSFAGPTGRRMYPSWQFEGNEPLPGLREVLGALPAGLHPLVVDHWATTPTADLPLGDRDLSPREWLVTGGDVRPVVEAASVVVGSS